MGPASQAGWMAGTIAIKTQLIQRIPEAELNELNYLFGVPFFTRARFFSKDAVLV